ncbi:MAG TPA: alanine racemase, partial [Bacillota bacterium]|nr:alanine racemase [Bacillota bacterium]
MPNAKTLRPVWAEIDLSNFKKNIGVVRDLIPKTSEIMAVVKANAYGIGAVPASKAALEAGASWLAVATPDEAVELREALPEANILVLGAVTSEAAEVLVNLGVSLTVTSVQGFADAENAAKRFNKKAKVHLKIDTGMGRIGFRPGAELESALDQIAGSCYVELEGAFTHFAAADVDSKYTEMQLARFK